MQIPFRSNAARCLVDKNSSGVRVQNVEERRWLVLTDEQIMRVVDVLDQHFRYSSQATE
jgi:hypothetical protein